MLLDDSVGVEFSTQLLSEIYDFIEKLAHFHKVNKQIKKSWTDLLESIKLHFEAFLSL